MDSKLRQSLLYLVSDWFAAILAWLAYVQLRGKFIQDGGEMDSTQLFIGFIMGGYWVAIYAVAGLYKKPFRRSRLEELIALFKFTLFGVIAFFFIIVLDTPLDPENIPYNRYRYYMTVFFLLQFFITAVIRFTISTRTNLLIRSRKLGFPSLLVGCQVEAEKIYNILENSRRYMGYKFVGYLCANPGSKDLMADKLPRLGELKELNQVVNGHVIEEIIIALEGSEAELIPKVIELADNTSANIKIVPGSYDYIVGSAKISHILGAPLIEIFPQIISNWEKVIKRLLDIGVSLVSLVLLIPIYTLIGLAVKLDSPGPIFYLQERIGKGGKPFSMVKFRSMYQDAESKGPALSSEDDPRITPVGRILRKMRLDELPQFWNVLKGDMSIVGPRPERRHYIDQIVKLAPHYVHLHKVRPGITSWGQVKYGYASTVEEMVERLTFDILYIEQMSLALDLKIMLYTFIVILEGRGK
ncbi:MAG: sugar transferase [Bacteroidota bacterium]